MSRLLLALQNGGALGGARVLSPHSVQAMQTPPRGVAGSTYGFGWQVGTHRGIRVGWHDGGAATSSGSMALAPDLRRGFVLLANQQHLLDSMIAVPELRWGVVDLLSGRAPAAPAVSTRAVGWGLLGVLVAVLLLLVRSLVGLHGWAQRAQGRRPGRLVREIAPRFVGPVVTLVLLYLVVPHLVGHAFTLRWVGAYFLPDVVLLLALGTVPDLLVGLYQVGVVLTQRWRTGPVGASRSGA